MTTPQLRPYVNFFGHFVDASMELDFLREFASRVEDLLVDGALRSSTGHRPLPDSIAAIAHDQQYLYTELFSPLLHESFVVSAVVFLERECRAFVEILAKALSVPLTLRDLNGSILERFRTFCSKVASLDLGVSQDLWQAVDGLVSLRNCIVHTGGLLEGSRDRKPVEHFLRTYKSPELRDGRIICSVETSDLVIRMLTEFIETIYRAALRRFPDEA
jgi:hypothetical protein